MLGDKQSGPNQRHSLEQTKNPNPTFSFSKNRTKDSFVLLTIVMLFNLLLHLVMLFLGFYVDNYDV